MMFLYALESYLFWLCLTIVEILFAKDCNSGLELRAWSLEKGLATQSSKLKALSNEMPKPKEYGISTVVKHSQKKEPFMLL